MDISHHCKTEGGNRCCSSGFYSADEIFGCFSHQMIGNISYIFSVIFGTLHTSLFHETYQKTDLLKLLWSEERQELRGRGEDMVSEVSVLNGL